MRKCSFLYAEQFTGSNTFSKVLEEYFQLRIINISDLIREILKEKSELGKKIQSHISRGLIVPPDLINIVVINSICLDKRDILIMGYPRNLEHFNLLDDALNNKEISINSVWYLKHDDLDSVAKIEYQNNIKVHDKYENTIESIKEKLLENAFKIKSNVDLFNGKHKINQINVDFRKNIFSEKNSIIEIIKSFDN